MRVPKYIVIRISGRALRLAVSLTSALAVILLVADFWGRVQIRRRLETLSASGAPVTIADLGRLHPPPKPEHDVMQLLAPAAARAVWASSVVTEFYRALGHSGMSSLDDRLVRQIESLIFSNREAISIALALNLVDAERGYAIGNEPDSFHRALRDEDRNTGTNSPLVRPGILFLHAVTEAREGRESSAAGSVIQGLRIAQALSSWYLPDHTTSRSLERRGVQVLEWIINHHQFPAADLQRMEAVLVLERPERIREVFVALRVMSVAEWKAVQAKPVGALTEFLGLPKTNWNPEPDWFDRILARSVATARHFLGQGYRHQDFRDCLDFWQETSAAFELAPGPCLKALDGIAARFEARFPTGSFAWESGAWFPNYFRDVRDDAETIARLRTARVALAILRWRAAHDGKLPESLAELVPDELPAVPADPFDEQPLRYRRLPQGFTVYSVGPDFTDNGGQRQPAGTDKTDGYDVFFEVVRFHDGGP